MRTTRVTAHTKGINLKGVEQELKRDKFKKTIPHEPYGLSPDMMQASDIDNMMNRRDDIRRRNKLQKALDKGVTLQQIINGTTKEMKENPEFTPSQAEEISLDHLLKKVNHKINKRFKKIQKRYLNDFLDDLRLEDEN